MHSPANNRLRFIGLPAVLLVFVLVTGSVLRAQPLLDPQPQPGATQNPRIAEILVEGAGVSSPNAIITFSGLRIGDELNADATAQAVRNLMDRRIFSDVKIFVEAYAGSQTQVRVTIAVQEYPRTAAGEDAVTFVGNDELDDDDLAEIVGLRSGDIISPYALDRAGDRIKEKYSDEGYLFTEVTSTLTPSSDSTRASVQFNIWEGPEVRIGNVVFLGNNQVGSSELRGAMEDVKEKSWWQFWRSSKFDRSKLAEDEQRIVEHYRSEGFIDAQVVGDSIDIDSASGRARITIIVDEGSRYYLRNLSLSGNSVYEDNVLLSRIDVEEGEPYDQVKVNQNVVTGNMSQTDLRALYGDNGYLTYDANIIENRVPGTDSIDVVIRINEGQQATIRYVTIAGNTKTRDRIIRRELRTDPGETFSRAAVIRSLRNLANLNYFNPETLRPDVAPVDNTATTVDVTYNVEERPSDTFNASVGISSQGLTGVLGLSFNNFDITEPFTAGGGQVLNFNWEFGSFTNTFSLGFTEPWVYVFDLPFTLGGNVFYQTLDYGDYAARRIGASATVGHRLGIVDDYTRIDGVFRGLSNEIIGETASTSQFENGSELSATIALSRSSVDSPIFPSVGSRVVFSNTLAGIWDAKYRKHELTLDFYSPVARLGPSNPIVLYLNTEFGVLQEFGDSRFVPPQSFFVMGGTVLSGVNTVPLRGYNDRSIGAQINGLRPGRVYAKSTAELRLSLAVNPIPIFVLAFAEAGNVWETLDQADPFGLRRSVGFGARVMVPPIGLLGFDYGYGFDPISGEPGWKFHFQYGR